MVMRVEQNNLFYNTKGYSYAQCISADFAMGAGIALEFNSRFNMRDELVYYYGSVVDTWDYSREGFCIFERPVYNLVTKRNHWDKPTYQSLSNALLDMHEMIKYQRRYSTNKLAIPKLGCGLDGLDWNVVSQIITDMFSDCENLEILVRYL